MSRVSVTTVAAVSAIVTFVMFAVGIALMASNGVQVLIPETGKEGLEWIADVDDAGDLFFAGPGWWCSEGCSPWSRWSASTSRSGAQGR